MSTLFIYYSDLALIRTKYRIVHKRLESKDENESYQVYPSPKRQVDIDFCHSNFEKSVKALLEQVDKFFILQVGANDGVSHGDVVYPLSADKRTCGVLMEPQPRVFKKLTENYSTRSNRFKLINSALSTPDSKEMTGTIYAPINDKTKKGCYFDNTGIATMLVDEKKRPLFIKNSNQARNSFNKGCLQWEKINITLTSADKLNLPSRYHLLQIDAEGMDDKIIYFADIDNFRPAIIRLEVKSVSRRNWVKLAAYLKVRGYRTLIRVGPDAFACKNDNFFD